MSTNEEIHRYAKERFNEASTADDSERALIEDDLKFEIDDEGHQWPAGIRESRESDNPPRPCLVMNKIPEKIDQVEGEFRQLKPSYKLRPVDSQGDPKIAEIYAGIIRHIEYNSNARSVYNSAHGSTLRCGRGAWRIDIQDAEDDPFVRDIVLNRIPNVLTVVWDPGAKKQDKSDAEYVFVSDQISVDKYKKDYPDASLTDWEGDATTWAGWRTEKIVRIAEYWWKEKVPETFYRVKRDMNGVLTELTTKTTQDTDIVVRKKEVKVTKVKWCKMNGVKIIDGPYDWPSTLIPIVIEIGKETNIGGKFKTRGMIRFGKVPQQMYNYWGSSMTEQIALAPKAPYLATAKMIGKYQGQWDQANIRNFVYLLYDADPAAPMAHPTRENPPQLSTAMADQMNRTEHDIMSAMGIYQASLGDQGNEKSGRAITARQRQGSIGSYVYTNNFEVSLIYSTKVLIDLIPYVYDTERIIRIRGEDDSDKVVPINARPGAPMMGQFQGKEEIPMVQRPETPYINDLTVGKYDFFVTIGPSYVTQREEAAAMMLDLTQSVPQIGLATADLIVKNIDLPGADLLAARLKRMVPIEVRGLDPGEKPPEPPPPDPKIMLEVQKLWLKTREEDRKDFLAQFEAIKMSADAEAAEKGQQLKEILAFVQELKSTMPQSQPPQGGPSSEEVVQQ